MDSHSGSTFNLERPLQWKDLKTGEGYAEMNWLLSEILVGVKTSLLVTKSSVVNFWWGMSFPLDGLKMMSTPTTIVAGINEDFESKISIPYNQWEGLHFSENEAEVPRLPNFMCGMFLSLIKDVYEQAKLETVEKVCSIMKKQLALTEDTTVTRESKFASLGDDSLDIVEIVMGLEEEFGISVEEESAQHIATVQDATDLIEELIEKNVA